MAVSVDTLQPVLSQPPNVKCLLLIMDIEGAERYVLTAVARPLPQETVPFVETDHSHEECHLHETPLLGGRLTGFVVRRRLAEFPPVEYVERALTPK